MRVCVCVSSSMIDMARSSTLAVRTYLAIAVMIRIRPVRRVTV